MCVFMISCTDSSQFWWVKYSACSLTHMWKKEILSIFFSFIYFHYFRTDRLTVLWNLRGASSVFFFYEKIFIFAKNSANYRNLISNKQWLVFENTNCDRIYALEVIVGKNWSVHNEQI